MIYAKPFTQIKGATRGGGGRIQQKGRGGSNDHPPPASSAENLTLINVIKSQNDIFDLIRPCFFTNWANTWF